MAIELATPDVHGLRATVLALREWQDDAAPMQLHPGDVGWFRRLGADATAAALRTWSRDGRLLAVGLLDGPDVLRLTTAPGARRDDELARRVVADAIEPDRGVLAAGAVSVEVPDGVLIGELLAEAGWDAGEPWTPLQCDLTAPVAAPGLRVEAVGPDGASTYAAVHRSSFGSPRFTDERWHVMAAGAPFADAQCLVAYDDDGRAVAAATVWSAGPGRPGLLEPVGVHAQHRGHGYGTAISVAAAAALRALGSSSALVCTPSANVAAVATYAAAGFRRLPQRLDRHRDA